MHDVEILNDPIFFESNRVWRCYTGGKMLDEFVGNATAVDGNFPEDWLGSVTRADNDEQQQSPDEGLTKLRGTDILFINLLKQYPTKALGGSHTGSLGVLCKFLDSAIRLPIQCHPDRKFARLHCNSEYGKTESWLILATRKINGGEPYILLGFKPGTTREQFSQAVMAQDIPAMTGFMHKFPVNPGEVYFIPGRIPHAIGPGLMLLEVQEPTDLVVQPERHIGNVTLSEKQMWGSLKPETALSCFDYSGTDSKDILNNLRLEPNLKHKYPGAVLESVINAAHTDCFTVDKLTVTRQTELPLDTPWHLGIVTSGSGRIIAQSEWQVKRGDSFFISNKIKKLKYICSPEAETLQVYLISTGKKK